MMSDFAKALIKLDSDVLLMAERIAPAIEKRIMDQVNDKNTTLHRDSALTEHLSVQENEEFFIPINGILDIKKLAYGVIMTEMFNLNSDDATEFSKN